MAKLLYVPGVYEVGRTITLPEDVQHRLARVMRMGIGNIVQVFDGEGHAAEVEITDGKCRTVRVTGLLPEKAALPRKVLVLGLPKREAWETALRQATEMGVTEIVPVKTRFSQVSRINRERAQALMVEAAEQCERYELPKLRDMVGLEDFLTELNEVCGWAYERLEETSDFVQTVMVLVGPEGGFAADEVEMLRKHKFIRAFSLGPTILRSDTAVVASLARLPVS